MLSFLLSITDESNHSRIIYLYNTYHDDMIKLAKYRLKKSGLPNYELDSEVTEKLEYIGSEKTDIKNLNIANQGGMILLRFTIANVSQFISDDAVEIKQDGTLLKQAGVLYEDLKYKVNFDLIITLVSGTKYKANILLDMPIKDLLEEGISSIEDTKLENIVFKRM